jgi:hypothetical protein
MEEGNELGSEYAECEGLGDAFGKGASGISVGAGGLVEYLIFGCVQPSQRNSITDTRTGGHTGPCCDNMGGRFRRPAAGAACAGATSS